MHRIVLAMLLLALGLTTGMARATSAPRAPAAPDFAAIDAYVEAQMHEQRIPGLALGIVQHDQIVHLKGFGVANPQGEPVTPQTPFSIGSLTKSFTAVAILQLVEAGQLDLDAPVQRYLSWFRVADREASSRITLRNLLNHASGLPRDLEIPDGGIVWHVGVPLALNLGWAALTLIGLPIAVDVAQVAYQIPDLIYILLASGVAALIWGVTRAVWAYIALRKRKYPPLHGITHSEADAATPS
jgi:CubicO group peptidase (beta-lactamase class C family)